MKRTALLVFRVLIGIVLIGKISNWILDYSDEINQILNTAMFILIGIAYTVIGALWDNKLIKSVLIVCGLYLITMNFLNKNTILDIIGIFCILIPLLIARFSPDETNEKELLEK